MLMVFGTAFAQDEVVFDFDTSANDMFGITGSSSGSGSTYVADGEFNEDKTATVDGFKVTVKASATDAATRNRIWYASPKLRLYNESFTVEAPAGKTITKVYFETLSWNSGKKVMNFNTTPDSGDLKVGESSSDKTATWTGSAQSIVFAVESNTQIGKLTITFSGDVDPSALKTPTIEGTTPFNGTTTVTITNPNDGGDIFYAKNLEDATAEQVAAEGTKYTDAIEISETTTILAVVKNGEKLSSVAKKTFTKVELAEAENIAAFKALEVNTEAKLTLADAQVLYAADNDVYVRDASGAIDFYATGLTFEAGQKLNGYIIGKKAVYNNLPELAKTTMTNAEGFTAVEGTVTPKEIGLDEVPGFICDLVVVKGVQIVKDGTNYYATNEDGDKYQVYDKFGIKYDAAAIEESKTYDITAIVIPFKETFELCPTEDFTGGAVVEGTPVASVADLLKLESPSTNLELTLTDAQVVYNDNNYIYVRENGSAVCFYSMTDAIKDLMKSNAIINGKVNVDYEVYNAMPEVKKNAKTDNNTLAATEGEEAVPTETTLANVAEGKNTCDLVTLKATLKKEVTTNDSGNSTTTYYLEDGDVKLVVVNNSKNLSKIEDGTEVTVTGVVNTTKNGCQVKLVKNAEFEGNGIQSIANEAVQATVYNLAGQRVNAEFKGVVIKNGKKYIVK